MLLHARHQSPEPTSLPFISNSTEHQQMSIPWPLTLAAPLSLLTSLSLSWPNSSRISNAPPWTGNSQLAYRPSPPPDRASATGSGADPPDSPPSTSPPCPGPSSASSKGGRRPCLDPSPRPGLPLNPSMASSLPEPTPGAAPACRSLRPVPLLALCPFSPSGHPAPLTVSLPLSAPWTGHHGWLSPVPELLKPWPQPGMGSPCPDLPSPLPPLRGATSGQAGASPLHAMAAASVRHPLFPASSESVRSVRIRSTTLVRLLHGLVLLPSGISVAGTGNAMI